MTSAYELSRSMRGTRFQRSEENFRMITPCTWQTCRHWGCFRSEARSHQSSHQLEGCTRHDDEKKGRNGGWNLERTAEDRRRELQGQTLVLHEQEGKGGLEKNSKTTRRCRLPSAENAKMEGGDDRTHGEVGFRRWNPRGMCLLTKHIPFKDYFWRFNFREAKGEYRCRAGERCSTSWGSAKKK